MLRKLIVLAVVAMLVAGMGGSPAQAVQGNPEIRIRVNGVFVDLDVTPTIEDGRTLVTARFPAEALGAHVEWEQETRMVSVSYPGKLVILFINSMEAFVNGLPVVLDVPPRIVDGRTLIPLRFFAEALDQSVYWDGDKRIVDIVSKGIGGPGLPEEFLPVGRGPEPDYTFSKRFGPVARAEFAARELERLGYDIDFSVEEGNMAFVLDAAIPPWAQQLIKKEMLWARKANSRLLELPELPMALFVTPSGSHEDATRAFLGFVYPGMALRGGIFSQASKGWDTTSDLERALINLRFWFLHEHVHLIQESVGGLGPTWWVEGGADYLAWKTLKNEGHAEHYEEHLFYMMGSALQPVAVELSLEAGASPYHWGSIALQEILIEEDVQTLVRFWREYEKERQNLIKGHMARSGSYDPVVIWKEFFLSFFGFSEEKLKEKMKNLREPLIQRMDQEHGRPWPWR